MRIDVWRDGDLYLYRLVERCCVEPDPWLPPRAHRDAGNYPSPQARGGRALQSSELTGRAKAAVGKGQSANWDIGSSPAAREIDGTGGDASRPMLSPRPVSSSPTGQLTLTEVAA